jgi:hypothetical protein
MGGLGKFRGVIAEQMQDAGSAVWLSVCENIECLPEGEFAKVCVPRRSCSIEPIKEGGDIEQPRAVLEKVLLHDLWPRKRAGGGNRFHETLLKC